MALFWIGATLVISSMIFAVAAYILRYRVSFFGKIFKFKILSAILQICIPFIGMYLIVISAKLTYPLGEYPYGRVKMILNSFTETSKLYSFEVQSKYLEEVVQEDNFKSISFLITNFFYVFSLYFSLFVVFCENFVKYLRNQIRVKNALKSECDIVVGYNSAIEYINAHFNDLEKKHQLIVWDNTLTEEQELELFGKRIPVIKKEFNFENIKKENFPYHLDNKINFISLNDEVTNIKYVSEFILFITQKINKTLIYRGSEQSEEMIGIYKSEKFNIFVELGINNLVTIQDKILAYREKTFDGREIVTVSPFIHFFNRYELNAMDFCSTKPITQYLPSNFIDTEIAAIRNDSSKKLDNFVLEFDDEIIEVQSDFSKMINVVFLGFGNFSKELYNCSVITNQIPSYEKIDDKQILKNHTINYFAFDNKTLFEGDKNNVFYHNRFNKESLNYDKNQYFKQPEETHRFYKCNCDLNFDNSIEHLLKIIGDDNENRFTEIVISLGEDLDNIDYALKVNLLLKQKGLSNYHIFVRLRKDKKEFVNYLNDGFTFFGQLDSILNHDVIVNDSLNVIAHFVDSKYNALKLSKDSWYSKDSIKHKSSTYAALNLRLKLNLLGFDYVEKDKLENEKTASLSDFLNFIPQVTYTSIGDIIERSKNDSGDYPNDVKMANTSKELLESLKQFINENEKILMYDDFLFFDKTADYKRFNVLGYQEKNRWNAFFIMEGYTQFPINKIKIVKNSYGYSFIKDDNKLKLHACLTDVVDLDKYHQKLAQLYSDTKEVGYAFALETTQTYVYDFSLINETNMKKIFFSENSIYKLIFKK